MTRVFLVVAADNAEAGRIAQQVKSIESRAEVLSANSGADAIRLLAERRVVPSLIFCEFELPDGNAIELLGEIRQHRWLEGVPVAVLAGQIPDRYVISCHRLGACAVIAMPTSVRELRETIRDSARNTVLLEPRRESDPGEGEEPRGATSVA